jgi:hypothetical protein
MEGVAADRLGSAATAIRLDREAWAMALDRARTGTRTGDERGATATVEPIQLAAARALFRAPQAEDACWADLELADGTVRACGRPEATTLGLCAQHLTELFGIEAPVQGRRGA